VRGGSTTPSGYVAGERVCPQCGARYGSDHSFCSVDGAALIAAEPTDELIGTIIADRYRVVKRIGAGGMGEVFLAEHVRIKRKSAVKVMRRSMISDPTSVMRFNREAENASQISHPNVAAVYDFGETNGLIYLAMEYIEGEPLSHTLAREGALSPVRVGEIIRQSADALSVAHQIGMLHRDLKPENIMLSQTRAGLDQVKIVDFGIARVIGSDAQNVTSTGIAVGTPDFMSPEQFSGEKLDVRSDIYSLALVAFNLLTAELAFPSPTSTEHLLARFTSRPRTLSQVRPTIDWPEKLQAVFDRSLASNPEERYGDVIDFALDFSEGLALLPANTEEHQYIANQQARLLGAARLSTPITPFPFPALNTGSSGIARPGTSGETRTSETPTRVPTPKPMPLEPPTGETPVLVPAGFEGEGEAEAEITPTTTATRAAFAPQSLEIAQVPRPSNRTRNAVIGGVALVAIGGLLWAKWAGGGGGSGGEARPVTDAPAVAPVPAATPDSTAVAGLSTPDSAASTGARASLRAVANASRASVMQLRSAQRSGAAVVVDPAQGLLLTSARVLRPDGSVDVYIDGARYVRGQAIHTDQASGLAVVAIAKNRCVRCTAARFAATDDVAKPGDSVVVVGGSSSRVASLDSLTATGFRVGGRVPALGGPVVAATGEVFGVAAGASEQAARYVPASRLAAVVSAGRAALTGAKVPGDSVFAVNPTEAFPAARLGAVASNGDVDPYRAKGPGIEALFMTPPVGAFRDKDLRETLNLERALNPNLAQVDPIQLWDGWQRFVGDRRSVVVLVVSPDVVAFPIYQIRDVINFRNGDVQGVKVLRDGAELVPLEQATTPAAVNAARQTEAKRPNFRQAVLVFRAEQLVSGDDLRPTKALELVVTDRTAAGPVRIQVPASVLDRIRRDFALR
jgi:serine/threonine protein kinase